MVGVEGKHQYNVALTLDAALQELVNAIDFNSGPKLDKDFQFIRLDTNPQLEPSWRR